MESKARDKGLNYCFDGFMRTIRLTLLGDSFACEAVSSKPNGSVFAAEWSVPWAWIFSFLVEQRSDD